MDDLIPSDRLSCFASLDSLIDSKNEACDVLVSRRSLECSNVLRSKDAACWSLEGHVQIECASHDRSMCLEEGLAVQNTVVFFVLALGHPHLLEGVKGSENGASDR